MSAEKCGNPIAVVLDSPKTVQEPAVVPEEALMSGAAFRMLKKIRHKHPNFFPLTVKEVWAKAYQMGLIEDE